jgi:hypothetical protein
MDFHTTAIPRPPARDKFLAVTATFNGHGKVIAEFPVTPLQMRERQVQDWHIKGVLAFVDHKEALIPAFH